ncbi:MAG: NAD(P)-dependent oxidoreductase [Proteobacteria bacterium]|nr:NAD(P)-dependent oxidoreductase [Pseudomonadota bacterium]
MKRVLMTGAAGGIGTSMRTLLPKVYPDLVLSDHKPLADLRPGERFVAADLTNLDEVVRACDGVDGVIHLGGFSVEGPWETILNANIVGCYNLFEAARKTGVKRVVFASSNHAVGFYPRSRTIPVATTVRPDTRYGVSKAFGEALGAMYAYKHGIGVAAIRIGHFGERPLNERDLAIWLAPDDLVQLIQIGLERPDLVFEVLYGISDNQRAFYDNSNARALGYAPAQRSEDYATEALAAERASAARTPVELFYQGGDFAAEEYSADLSTLNSRS